MWFTDLKVRFAAIVESVRLLICNQRMGVRVPLAALRGAQQSFLVKKLSPKQSIWVQIPSSPRNAPFVQKLGSRSSKSGMWWQDPHGALKTDTAIIII